jgi:serine protease AprX
VLTSRILGLLKMLGMQDRLIEKVRDPLKGQIDWKADRSYKGEPALDGANIRLNGLLALGQMGDAKALDVMLDALDDPILYSYVLDPLEQIAKDVNEKADDATLAKVRDKLTRMLENPNTTRQMRAVRINAANTLFQYKGGVDAIKAFVARTANPNFKRHALSALLSNNYATSPDHPDYALVKDMIYPALGVEKLHADGITGKGMEMAIVDGGLVDRSNKEAFQNRVHLPASSSDPEHYHPTMVMSTAAGNGKLKGVAPDAVVYSDKWPDLNDAEHPVEVYKKLIEGKLRGENNIRVINNSWGFTNQQVVVFKEVRNILSEFKKVVDMAEKAGIQIVFAAGNDGENPGVPTLGTLSLFGIDVDKLTAEEKKEVGKDLDYILDKVILVGAVNTQGSDDIKDHRMAEFSSVGDSINARLLPTIVAPGVDMMVYGWEKNGRKPKELVNGTSFACPYVSGLITLLGQTNPKLTPRDIREILVKTAVKLDGVPAAMQGAGEVQPLEAVAMAKTYGRKPRSRNPRAMEMPQGPSHKKAPVKEKPGDQPAVIPPAAETPGNEPATPPAEGTPGGDTTAPPVEPPHEDKPAA